MKSSKDSGSDSRSALEASTTLLFPAAMALLMLLRVYLHSNVCYRSLASVQVTLHYRYRSFLQATPLTIWTCNVCAFGTRV